MSSDLFKARTRRKGGQGGRKPRSTPVQDRAEATGPAKMEIRAFEQGPFPAVVVPKPDPVFFTLVERLTGRPIDSKFVEAYERVRAFRGYLGPVLTSSELNRRHLGDPIPNQEPEDTRPRPPASSSEVIEALPADIDPFDLGD